MAESTLLCFDLNGTLLSSSRWVSEKVYNHFLSLIKKHPNWCIVTSMGENSKTSIKDSLLSSAKEEDRSLISERLSSRIVCVGASSKGVAIKKFISQKNLSIDKIIVFDDMPSNLEEIKETLSDYTVETHSSL